MARIKKEKNWQEKRRRALRVRLLLVLGFCLLAALIYGLVSAHYMQVFLPGTVVNGVSIAGMNTQEAEEALKEEAQSNYTLTLQFRGGDEAVLSGSTIDLRAFFLGGVNAALDGQNHFSWPLRLFAGHGDEQISIEQYWDEGKARAWLNALPQLQEDNMAQPVDAGMQFGDNDELEVKAPDAGTYLLIDNVYAAMQDSLMRGERTLDLEEAGAYAEPKIKADNPELLNQINKLNGYLGTQVTLEMSSGQKVVVDKTVIKDWLSPSSTYTGWYEMDTQVLMSNIEVYVQSLADNYNASYGYYDFQSTSEGVVTLPVSSASFGYMIDKSAESEALFQDVISGTVEERIPRYSVATPFDHGVGSTYIEVDTILQKVYLYVDGQLNFTTDCVTGLATDPARVTPSGIYALYSKEEGRTLQGTVEEDTGQPEYSAAVSYWMPFSGGYGLHDASWRPAFGGQIYQTNGSHGCVNLPVMSAATIYNAVEVGTPVVII